VGFHQRQAVNTKDLVATRVRSQSEVVGRLERLVEVGSDSPRDLNLERANLMERKLEADRQTHEAQATLHAAERHQAALELQLEQAGLSPELLSDPVPGRGLVVAEVPETRMAGVREGQRCSVRFYADPDPELQGKVARVLPTVSTAQRALRVLIVLDGAKDSVRPGMFADVGIGTDKRAAVRIPPRAVVHVGHSDYVLVQRPDGYEARNVALGAAENGSVEVLSGVNQGERVMADGVVLLKPVIASVVHAEALL
jgi:multidrug efflux pump subunit AcrA (membrane-fusion protein)